MDDHNKEKDSEELGDVLTEEAQVKWKSLYSFTKKQHVPLAILSVILSIISGAIIPVQAYFIGRVFDLFTEFANARRSGDDLIKAVSTNATYLAILASIMALTSGVMFSAWVVLGELQAKSAREELYNAMLHKDMVWYDTRKAGMNTIIPRFQAKIRELQLADSQPLGLVISHIATLFAAFGLAMYSSWDLTLVTVSSLPVGMGIVAWLSNRMQPDIQAQSDQMDLASKAASNAISNIEIVKCFNGQQTELQRYSAYITKGAYQFKKVVRKNAFQIGILRFFVTAMFVQGFWYGSHIVQQGKKTPGEVLTTFWSCVLATTTIESIVPQMIVLEKGRAAGAILKAILSTIKKEGDLVLERGGSRPTFCEGDITVEKVSFSYPSRPDQLALKNVNFEFPAGETTFVLGKSGSGKSTLSNLLLRFYEPNDGSITIDGEKIQHLDIGWLRNNVTLVQQSSVLFNETLFKNIAFGHNDYDALGKEETKASIELADLVNVIVQMPDGLNTVVGYGGSALSGGQRQKVAIARACLRDTAILILDEATSALDHTSKSKVMQAIRRWRKGKTTIIITHDWSQIEQDDYAYILEQGVIVEDGYRKALEKSGSAFARFKETTQEGVDKSAHLVPLIATEPQVPIQPESGDNVFDREMIAASNIGHDLEDETRAKDKSRMLSMLPSAYMGDLGKSRHSMMPMQSMMQETTERPMTIFIDNSDSDSETEDSKLMPPEAEILEPPPRLSTLSTSQLRRLSGLIRQAREHDNNNSISTGLEQMSKRSGKDEKKEEKEENKREILPLAAVLKTVLPNLGPKERWALIFGFIMASVKAGCTPVFAWGFTQLLTIFFRPVDTSAEALKWSLIVLAIGFVDAISSFLMYHQLEKAAQKWADNLRNKALERILDQPKAWFDQRGQGIHEMVSVLDRSAEEMRNIIGRFAGFIWVAMVMMISSIAWCLISSWKLTLVGLAFSPVFIVLTRSFEKVSGVWESKCNQISEVASGVFTETFSNIRTVRALTLEAYFHRKYTMASFRAVKVGFKRAILSGVFFGLTDGTVIFLTGFIFWYGGVLTAKGEFSVTAITQVMTMLTTAMAQANAIAAFIPQINSSRDTASQLLRYSSLPLGASHEYEGKHKIREIPGPITFNNVTFRYPTREGIDALSSVTLSITPRSSTALVGASGSGKSTIVSLLLGLYPLQPELATLSRTNRAPEYLNGLIAFGPYGLPTLQIPSLRTIIGYVPQTPTLFPGTVAENIAYGIPGDSQYRLIESVVIAARNAGIAEFVESLPLGYSTLVGEGGTMLSGGQIQRLAIARALVRRPQLLIMDEPTSNLDLEASEGIRAVLRMLVRTGITVVVVSHSVEMMRACDRCVVLGQGKVLEVGPFESLMRAPMGKLRGFLASGDDLT